jgi:ergothioneine biosynthesis protein EgtB
MATALASITSGGSGFSPNAFQGPPRNSANLAARFSFVRQFSHALCDPLAIEDQVIQTMPDASPTKWHLLHTTWFFETFVLREAMPDYQPFHPLFEYLYNSYYNGVGKQFPRPQRGNLSRPTVEETRAYRAYVDDHMARLLERPLEDLGEEMVARIIIGLHHEQQHQELLLTDVKTVLCANPLRPVYTKAEPLTDTNDIGVDWLTFPEGLYEIGYEGQGFHYDNEGPRHRVFLEAYALADRLVTNREFIAFMEDGGYDNPMVWLSEGWAAVQANGWRSPLYWEQRDGEWWANTLNGFRPVVLDEPVCHVSYFEADAFARWAGARLPSEAEWEMAVREQPLEGNFVEQGHFHPRPADEERGARLRQCFGDLWEWTRSPYVGYPGYTTAEGALGEYNGKFMCNQMVLRGGSCATSWSHIRSTYRNFFGPAARWQFSGLRLAREA